MIGKRDNMMNKKGQALVEFIMILPVFLLLVLGMIDFGKIIIEKYTLQNKLDLIVELYKNGKQEQINKYLTENNLALTVQNNEDLVTLTVTKTVDISTPGINKVLDDPYIVKESVTIANET